MTTRLTFGDTTLIKQQRAHLKAVNKNTKPPKKVEHPCQFQVFVPGLDGCNRSKPCQNEALENGWCDEHKDAQVGMDLGAKINYRSIEIPVVHYGNGKEPSKIILGQGEDNWREYFGKARGKGLETVLNYLQSRIQ